MSKASDIIELLGGAAKVAGETGFPLTTVNSWKASNFIPEWRQSALLAMAGRLKKPLAATDFPPKEERVSRSQAAA